MDYYDLPINLDDLYDSSRKSLRHYGRKPFILSGIVIFMIGAFFSGTSKDIIQLIVYRGIQGVGAGIIIATAFTAIGDLFSPRERGRWAGLMSGVYCLMSFYIGRRGWRSLKTIIK